jgi:putative addiction module component (TIGR02574 family)
MNVSLEDLKLSASHLTVPERAELVDYLLQSLEPDEEGATQAWHAELRRRMEDIRSGEVVGRPVEEVLARLREKYP